MDKAAAKEQIKTTCGAGWLVLVDIIYDNKPQDIEIDEVFQKWGGLKVDYRGEDEDFEYLLENIYHISQYMCEICGASGGYTIIDGWETTLCAEHFEQSEAKQKYKR